MSCYSVFNSVSQKELPSECITKYSRTPTSSYPTIPEKILGNVSPTNEFLVVYNENRKTCLPRDTEYYKRHFYNFDNLCIRPEQTADIAFSRQGVPTRQTKCVRRGPCKCKKQFASK